MSIALRLSIIMVLLLAASALGLIAYSSNMRGPQVVEAAHSAPAPNPVATAGYFVATHPLPAGTFVRDEDFELRTGSTAGLPEGAIVDTADARVQLRGSLVRLFIDTGHPITAKHVLRPRDRGFLASVLAPDTRAISINVDAESGVSGLIWPGDYVDVVLNQVNTKADAAHRSVSEILLRNVRIIAKDQDIVEGAAGKAAPAGKTTQSVSLQLSPEQVKKVTVAKDLGKLSLAVRSAVEHKGSETADSGPTSGCDVSPAIARQIATAEQNTTIEVYANGKMKQFTVKRQQVEYPTGTAPPGCVARLDLLRESAEPAKPHADESKE